MKSEILFASALSCLVLIGCTKNRFPVIEIETQDTVPINGRTTAYITFTDSLGTSFLDGEISRRGGMSINYEKHSYKLTLNQDRSLFGFFSDEDWILNANYIDKTFMRHKLSYDLFLKMDEENIAPHSHFIELYLNSEYKGLYVLMEQMERTRLGIDAFDSSSFILKDPEVFIPYKNRKSGYDESWQKFPDTSVIDLGPWADSITSLLEKPLNVESEQFIRGYFDWNNIADWHILILLTNNGDGIIKNFYLYKSDSTCPIKVSPWDYDHSFGRDGDGELNMLKHRAIPERNLLIQRLMELDSYRIFLSERWREHRQSGLINVVSINHMIDEYDHQIRKAVVRNNKIWPVNSWRYYDSAGYDEELLLMRTYTDSVIPLLDEYFETLSIALAK